MKYKFLKLSKTKVMFFSFVLFGLFYYFIFLDHGYINENGSRENATRYSVQIVGSALQRFKSDYKRYPSNEEGLLYLTKAKNPDHPYIEELGVDGWGRQLVYKVLNGGETAPFTLYSIGRNGIDENGSGDDIKFKEM